MITFMHVDFRVEDYQQWKSGFDASLPQRQMAGEVSYQILRNVDDEKSLTVVSVLKNAAVVGAFIKAPTFLEAMKASGISQMGQVFLLEEIDGATH